MLNETDFARATIAVYREPPELRPGQTIDLTRSSLTVLKHVVNNFTGGEGYIARHNTSGSVVVGFRGTDNIFERPIGATLDWFGNFAHLGTNQFESIWPDVEKTLIEVAASGQKVYFVGHSLGAFHAEYAAYRAALTGLLPAELIGLRTFNGAGGKAGIISMHGNFNNQVLRKSDAVNYTSEGDFIRGLSEHVHGVVKLMPDLYPGRLNTFREDHNDPLHRAGADEGYLGQSTLSNQIDRRIADFQQIVTGALAVDVLTAGLKLIANPNKNNLDNFSEFIQRIPVLDAHLAILHLTKVAEQLAFSNLSLVIDGVEVAIVVADRAMDAARMLLLGRDLQSVEEQGIYEERRKIIQYAIEQSKLAIAQQILPTTASILAGNVGNGDMINQVAFEIGFRNGVLLFRELRDSALDGWQEGTAPLANHTREWWTTTATQLGNASLDVLAGRLQHVFRAALLEAIAADNLEGLPREAVNLLANYSTNKIVDGLVDWAKSGFNGQPSWGLPENFNEALQVGLNTIATHIGNKIGTKAAANIVDIENLGEAIGFQLGAALGSAAGVAFATGAGAKLAAALLFPIPGAGVLLGAALGSFAGGVVGEFVADWLLDDVLGIELHKLFGDDGRFQYHVWHSLRGKDAFRSDVVWKDVPGPVVEVINKITDAHEKMLEVFLENLGAVVNDAGRNKTLAAFSWTTDQGRHVTLLHGPQYAKKLTTSDPAALIQDTVVYNLKYLKIEGMNTIVERVVDIWRNADWTNSGHALAELVRMLDTAKFYIDYLRDTEKFNTLLASDPSSAFSADILQKLYHIVELNLNDPYRYVDSYDVNSLSGADSDDTLFGLAHNDSLSGYAGDDFLSGDSGDDLVLSGAGNDTVYGGTGNDLAFGGRGDDVLVGASIALAGPSVAVSVVAELAGIDQLITFRSSDPATGNTQIFLLDFKSSTHRLIGDLGASIAAENIDVSADGGLIVFSKSGDLFTLDVITQDIQQISSGNSIDLSPRFSSDAGMIFFSRNNSQGGSDIYVSDLSGIMPKLWLSGVGKENLFPAHQTAKDGQLLYVHRPLMQNDGAIRYFGGVGSIVETVSTTWGKDFNDQFPSFSISGDHVVYQTSDVRKTANDITLVDREGAGLFLVDGTKMSGNHIHPIFLNNDNIIFSSNSQGNFDLFLVRRDGGGLKKIFSIAGDQDRPILLGPRESLAPGLLDRSLEAGADTLFGDEGDDTLIGAAGDDILNGGRGADFMTGSLGNDTYAVDNVGDRIDEQFNGGYDSVFVSVGAWTSALHLDVVYLSGTARSVLGNAGAEQLVANSSIASQLDGQGGDDVLWGSAFADTLIGGTGNDILRGQGGADSMEGGAGNDQYVLGDAGAIVFENTGEGTDTIWVAVSGISIATNVEIARLVTNNATITGNPGNDIIASGGTGNVMRGAGGNDEIWSSAAAETLDGGAGDDVLRGQGGADAFVGGAGNDQFVLFSAAATVAELAGGGYDVAWIAASGWTMPGEVEVGRLIDSATTLTGSAMGENLVANQALGSTLSGMGGNDILWGSTLADTFDGGANDDIFYSYGGGDRFIYRAPGWGADQISGFNRADGAKLDFTGLGLSFAAIRQGFLFGGGNGQISIGPDRILVYGVTSFQASDFIF